MDPSITQEILHYTKKTTLEMIRNFFKSPPDPLEILSSFTLILCGSASYFVGDVYLSIGAIGIGLLQLFAYTKQNFKFRGIVAVMAAIIWSYFLIHTEIEYLEYKKNMVLYCFYISGIVEESLVAILLFCNHSYFKDFGK